MSIDAQAISPASHIIIKGARQHNLKNVDLVLPKGKLIVFTGLSGSGKSSLAFDTIYAEGQRKYVESLSSYARQFLGIMQKPDVDQIDGLSPAISIDQKTTSHNPRSTVGTITEIYDYLRLLYARIGHPECPNCQIEIAPQTVDQIVSSITQQILDVTRQKPVSRWLILSPVVTDRKGEFSGLLANLKQKGFSRVRIDGRVYELDEDIVLIKTNRHSISAVVDRITFEKKHLKDEAQINQLKSRLQQSVSSALDLADGMTLLSEIHDSSLAFPDKPTSYTDHTYSQHLACPQCGTSFSELEPRLFSFNTPHGACPTCTGLGQLLKIDPEKIIAPSLTLSEGAVIPLANAVANDTWYARKLRAVVEAEGGDFRVPYEKLDEAVQHIILYGSSKMYHVRGSNREGREASFDFEHEGIVPELERRYQETTSDYMRSEIGKYMQHVVCPDCYGARLKPEALAVHVANKSIHDVVSLSVSESLSWSEELFSAVADEASEILTPQEKQIAYSILKEIVGRLTFLNAVGLSYLTLHREAGTLAGGEAQRIRLASQIGTGLTGVLYVLDEPTIGLHPRDNERLIATMERLRDLGNTVIVVEHDTAVMLAADHVVDFGPKAGLYGGEVIFEGTPKELLTNKDSMTGAYLAGKKSIDARSMLSLSKKLHDSLQYSTKQFPANTQASDAMVLQGASEHNLKDISVSFPLKTLTVVTGVSGSGKSTLVHDTLYPAMKRALGRKAPIAGSYSGLTGTDGIDKVHLIDQSPIGRTPRSNPATYTKAFDQIRQIFAQTKDAQIRGFKPGRFSFNVKGGRCEACQGGGEVKISMQFLSDVYVTCDVCSGKRYNAETLAVKYKGKSIAQVLDMTVSEALSFFANHTSLSKKLATLHAVGLGYIKLGQQAPTLSGGEAQRVKLSKELSIQSQGHTVYLMDEPTTGLHFEDVKNLMVVLKQLVSYNNTVIVIEHNVDVMRNADWIIDLGPEGGDAGGEIVTSGTPEDVAASGVGYTSRYLV